MLSGKNQKLIIGKIIAKKDILIPQPKPKKKEKSIRFLKSFYLKYIYKKNIKTKLMKKI